MKNRIKILLVDDSPTQKMKIQSILEEANYSVKTVDDGIKALHFLETTHDLPDIILSDIFMPNMDGFELCLNIRSKYPNIPLIILTSHNDEQNLKKAFNSGAVDYIGKPFTKTEVLMRISNILRISNAENLLSGKIKELKISQIKSVNIHDSLKKILYDARDAIFIISGNDFVDCNQAAVKLLNAKFKKEVLAIHPSELSPEKQLDGRNSFEKFNEMMEIAYKEGFHRFEWMHRKITGEIFPVEVSLTAIEYDNKLVLHTLWKDLTEKKKNEELLKKIEFELKLKASELDQVFNTTTNWMRIIDFDYNVIRINASMAKMLKKDKSELIGKKCYEIFPGPQCNTTECPIQKMVRDGKTFEADIEKECPDGVHPCILSVTPFTRADGKIIGIVENFRDIANRKSAEKKLIESEKRFRDISLSSGSWVWEIDKNGVFTYCSEGIVKVLGYSVDELIGTQVFTLMPPKESIRTKKIYNQLFKQKEKLIDKESIRLTKDGRQLILLSSAYPVLDEKGEFICYRGTSKDITARKKIEENLRIARERLTLALEGSYTGIWDWNIKSGDLLLDETWCNMIGYLQKELKPHLSTWVNRLHPDDKAKTMEKLNKHFNDQKYVFSSEFRLKTKNGEWKWILGKGRVSERDSSGKPLRMLGIHTDITIKKELEIALEKSEAQLQGLLDNSPDMIVHINTGNRITWANKTVLDLFPDAIGKKCIFSNSGIPCKNCPIAEVLTTGKLKKGLVTTHKISCHSREQFWETIGVPLKDAAGKVTGVLKISRNATERIRSENKIKQTNKELEELAFTDTLTGLINRKPFIDLLEKNISKHRRAKQKLALLFMDLDNFKNINDIYGHEVGDDILIRASEKIRKCMRESDFIGRFGGDEFMFCLDNIDSPAKAVHIAQKLNKDFSEKIIVDKKIIDMGVSIGIAIYPNDGNSANDLIKNSDLAMYRAKKQRKNSFNLYSTAFEKELLFDQALRCALENNEFKLAYQVIVDKNQKPYCVEALLRWENPKFGTVMPMDFIPALNKDRSIVEVGEWVFREACTKLKAFNNRNNQQILISINISQFQLEDDLFVGKIEKIIKETNVDPKNILLEITERIQIKKSEEVKKTLIQLKEIGIGFIALDDFGTGYSSFSNLVRHPIDVVKIDKFFIDRLDNGKNSDITAALVTLIKKYDLNVIVEGIETREQFELLKNMGCDYFQGYYFSKPQEKIVLP